MSNYSYIRKSVQLNTVGSVAYTNYILTVAGYKIRMLCLCWGMSQWCPVYLTVWCPDIRPYRISTKNTWRYHHFSYNSTHL